MFLSHAEEDKQRVREMAEALRDGGLRVWFNEWVIRPGDDIFTKIEDGLQRSRTLVLCLSEAALGSEWVGLERNSALFRDPGNVGRRFVPVLMEACDLPDTLARYACVDWRDGDGEGPDKLAEACRALEEEAGDEGRERIATLEREIKDCSSWTNSLAISPDGRRIVGGFGPNRLLSWSLDTGEEWTAKAEIGNEVWAIAFTDNGQHILITQSDGKVLVCAAKTLKAVVVFEGHSGSVNAVAVIPKTRTAVSGGANGVLKFWDIDTGATTASVDAPDSVFSIAVTNDGHRLIAGLGGGSIAMVDVPTGTVAKRLQGHSSAVHDVQITPDQRSFVSASRDRTLKVWNTETGTCRATLEGHESYVHSIAIEPNGGFVASTGFQDHKVRLWSLETGEISQVLEFKSNIAPIAVALTPDGTRMAVGTADGVIYIYRITPPKPHHPTIPRYTNAKIVLLGESASGKTTLARRLIDDKFVRTDSTHGMNVWRLEGLPVDEKDDLEREALLWDLAGQEDYRLIHQLFLDETALALVLIHPQKDDPFEDAVAWLKALAAVVPEGARKAEKLLIASKVDRGTMKVGQVKIDRFIADHGFAGFLETSAKKGLNCSDRKAKGPSELKKLIAAHVPWDRLPWTSTPAMLRRLKNAVLDLKEDDDVRLMRFPELATRLRAAVPEAPADEAQFRTAVTLVANHGLVMPLDFGDLVLMEPETLNGYAGAVVRQARAHVDEIGAVCEQHVHDCTIDLDGVDRMDGPDEELLARALVRTLLDRALCIAEDTPEGRHLVFPSQYRREREIPEHPEVLVSYGFSGELATIYTTLVVRLWYSAEFDSRELWRDAAEFTTVAGHGAGLRMERHGEGKATLHLFFEVGVPDDLKVVFVEYAHKHLHRHARDVRRDRRYVCDCGKPVTDKEAVRSRLEDGKDFIICQHCDEKVPLIDNIERRLGSDAVARKVMEMEAEATRRLDTQALEQILIGHMMAICGEASQIFKPVTLFDTGIDGEIEFKDNAGDASGKKVYVQLKHGDSYLRRRKRDDKLVFDVKNPRHLEYWRNQPVDVWLVVRDGEGVIRWMNVTRYLNTRRNKQSRQIVFDGEKLDMQAIWRLRDDYIPRVMPT